MIKLPVSHGEAMDRFTILMNKFQNVQNPQDMLTLFHDVRRLMVAVDTDKREDNKYIDSHQKDALGSSLLALRNANQKLWQLEEAIRAEGLLDATRAKLVLEIHKWNTVRNTAKNAITTLLNTTLSNDGTELVEVKDYGTSGV